MSTKTAANTNIIEDLEANAPARRTPVPRPVQQLQSAGGTGAWTQMFETAEPGGLRTTEVMNVGSAGALFLVTTYVVVDGDAPACVGAQTMQYVPGCRVAVGTDGPRIDMIRR